MYSEYLRGRPKAFGCHVQSVGEPWQAPSIQSRWELVSNKVLGKIDWRKFKDRLVTVLSPRKIAVARAVATGQAVCCTTATMVAGASFDGASSSSASNVGQIEVKVDKKYDKSFQRDHLRQA